MGKKSRRKSEKVINLRSSLDRVNDVQDIKDNFASYGLTSEMEDVQTFYNILDTFIETGESSSGSIKLQGVKRIVEYILTNNNNKQLNVKLAYDKTV
jgi:hypothetical protein